MITSGPPPLILLDSPSPACGALFKFIGWMMDLPKGLSELFWEEVAEYEKEKHMPFMTTPERIGMEKGLLIGIEAYLDWKFGAEGLKLLPEIRQIQDHEVLQTVVNAIKMANTPDELRRVWAKPEQKQ